MNVPDGWRVATLGEVGAEARPGFASGRHSRTEGGVLHLRPMNITRLGCISLDDAKYVSDSSDRRVRQGDVLFNNTNSPALIGKTALVSAVGDGLAYSNHMTRVRVDAAVLDPGFLALQLHHLWETRYFESICSNHVNQASVGAKKLLETRVLIPPVTEQRRILEMVEEHLAHLDAANTSLAQVEKRVTAFEAAALEAHFGTSAAPEATVPLGDLIDTITAGKSLGAASARAAEGEWGIIKVSAMTWGEFRPDENKAIPIESAIPKNEIRSGDLLVSRANTHEYVGASVLVDSVRPRLLLSDKSLRVTPRSEVPAEWLWRALQAPSARQQIRARATGTKDSMRNISQSALRAVRLPKTDGTSQRDALSKYRMLSGASKRARAELQRQHTHSQALRRATLTAAFSGRLTTTTDPRDLLQDAVPR